MTAVYTPLSEDTHSAKPKRRIIGVIFFQSLVTLRMGILIHVKFIRRKDKPDVTTFPHERLLDFMTSLHPTTMHRNN
jgi:hypothetical protein